MGKLSREKGKRYERHIAKFLRSCFPEFTIYRALQADRAYQPDVVVEGIPEGKKRPWLECCHSKSVNIQKKFTQAVRDIGKDGRSKWIPLVVTRIHGSSVDMVTTDSEGLNDMGIPNEPGLTSIELEHFVWWLGYYYEVS